MIIRPQHCLWLALAELRALFRYNGSERRSLNGMRKCAGGAQRAPQVRGDYSGDGASAASRRKGGYGGKPSVSVPYRRACVKFRRTPKQRSCLRWSAHTCLVGARRCGSRPAAAAAATGSAWAGRLAAAAGRAAFRWGG